MKEDNISLPWASNTVSSSTYYTKTKIVVEISIKSLETVKQFTIMDIVSPDICHSKNYKENTVE